MSFQSTCRRAMRKKGERACRIPGSLPTVWRAFCVDQWGSAGWYGPTQCEQGHCWVMYLGRDTAAVAFACSWHPTALVTACKWGKKAVVFPSFQEICHLFFASIQSLDLFACVVQLQDAKIKDAFIRRRDEIRSWFAFWLMFKTQSRNPMCLFVFMENTLSSLRRSKQGWDNDTAALQRLRRYFNLLYFHFR